MNFGFTKLPEGVEELEVKFFDSIKNVNKEDWNTVNPKKNIYLDIPYLEALEAALKEEIVFSYLQFYNKQGKPVAIGFTQLVKFVDKGSKYNDQLCKISGQLKATLLRKLDVKVLVCGNVFSCGENGFMHIDELASLDAYSNLNMALLKLKRSPRMNGNASIILLKEFWPSSFENTDHLKTEKYRDFMIDVNMVLKIHPSWNTLQDYLQSMTTKFRTKANSVFKKSTELERKEFSSDQIIEHQNRIEELYDFVLEKSDFNIGSLNAVAFSKFKKGLKDQFRFNAYFLDDQLIGFSTAFIYEDTVDANYVGIDYMYNIKYAVYQRMLYDFVELAINKKAKELRLGRTAEEIKSCLGAEPTNMRLYIKHANTVSNKIIKPIISSISPSEFELRKPFKASFA